MNKISILGLLLILVSCGQKTSTDKIEPKIDTSTTNVEANKQSAIPSEEPGEHETFHETINKISDALKVYIPQGYSVINTSTRNADLDDLTDQILVLIRITKGTTSDYENNKAGKRPFLLLVGQSDHSFTCIQK